MSLTVRHGYQPYLRAKALHVCDIQGFRSGAENGARTRDPQLGKLMLYQLSYFRNYFPKTLQI